MTATFPIRSTRLLALALGAALAACDGESAPPQDPARPLTTLAGQLRAAGSGAAAGPLRLALAWYPDFLSETGLPVSQPRAIVTQDVAYPGTLPQAYAFDVREAPPAGALSPMPEGWVGKGAIGILLAYQDGNGNGALDTIPADGTPVDHVVGASLEWTASPAFLVVYLTADQPAAPAFRQGFNLLRISDVETTEVVPLATSIPITVSEGGPLLDLFVCEAAWDGSGAQAPCGLELDAEPALDAVLEGEIYVGVDGADAAFGLDALVDGQPVRITDAIVTLDGVEIPFDEESGSYWATGLDLAMFAEARSVELVATRGEQVLRREIAIPAFELTVPAAVTSGTAFDVAWTVPESAESFEVYLFAGPTLYLHASGLEASPYHVTPFDYVGEARLTVVAHAGAELPVTVVRSTAIAYEAP